MNSARQILVTSALPYANGELHLGHILEVIQADIWVRHMKQQGHQVHYVCGEDAHGASVMIRAEQEQLSPQALAKQMQQKHADIIARFDVQQDFFHTTDSQENQELAESIFKHLEAAGAIITKTKHQLFDPEKQLFLADRFVKGTCPKCKATDQYGDNCEVCGATYEPRELIEPRSVFTGATPELKAVEQLYFDLPQYQEFLSQWLDSGSLQASVANKLREWVDQGLQPWDISRESPYFGFEIPGNPGKYFYVWLDAPIGYMASFKAFCKSPAGQDLDFNAYWQANSQTELYHFIGKDIVNFHGLFWPAMLHTAKLRLPTQIFVHGFVMINGEKMSKSRGTFIQAQTYLEHFEADALRYYYAAKLTSKVDDIDLNLKDFAQKVNTDLVGKVVNIASRCAKFIATQFNSTLSTELTSEHQSTYDQAVEQMSNIAQAFEARETAQAVQLILKIADETNRLIDEAKPWVTAKDPAQQTQTHQTASFGVNMFRLIMTCLAPVVPQLAHKAQAYLQLDQLDWQAAQSILSHHQVAQFKPMAQRLDAQAVEQLLGQNKPPKTSQPKKPSSTTKDTPMTEQVATTAQAQTNDSEAKSTSKPEITIDDFMKLDLRLVEIETAEPVEKSDKLLRLVVKIGNNETRQIFAGMKEAYTNPADLVGKKVVALVNLKPRKMRFGVSEGMILGAGPGGSDVFMLTAHEGAATGMNIS